MTLAVNSMWKSLYSHLASCDLFFEAVDRWFRDFVVAFQIMIVVVVTFLRYQTL